MTLTAAIIGTGANPGKPSRKGYAMAYRHATGYERLEECELVACADIVRENAEAFADAFDIGSGGIYEDYEQLCREVEPDIVSICVPPGIHAELTIGCARSGAVRAIHCEKPMATTWGDCREMARVCKAENVQLTVNHQMRFGRPFSKAKALLEDGAIGELKRMEFADDHLFDTGTHLFDLCNFYAGETDVEWVLAQIDYREENRWFGAHNENQALSQWRYENGVYGLASTGHGSDFLDCHLRLLGSEGAIEIRAASKPVLRVRREDSSWKTIDTGHDQFYRPRPSLVENGLRKTAEQLPGAASEVVERLATAVANSSYTDRAIADAVGALRENRESGLGAHGALRTSELIFASWESARRRGRVDLPLTIEDNPLTAMIESGQLTLERRQE